MEMSLFPRLFLISLTVDGPQRARGLLFNVAILPILSMVKKDLPISVQFSLTKFHHDASSALLHLNRWLKSTYSRLKKNLNASKPSNHSTLAVGTTTLHGILKGFPEVVT